MLTIRPRSLSSSAKAVVSARQPQTCGGARLAVQLREARADDTPELGRIAFEGFRAISSTHGFPWDFPSAQVAAGVIGGLMADPGFYGVVAQVDGKLVGSNFLDERDSIAGIGPITVDPAAQNKSVGRQLMQAVMDRAKERGFAGTRLVQAAYHNRSLSLYTKLGFDTREPLSKMIGAPPRMEFAGYRVRAAAAADLAPCKELCVRVHGHDRGEDLRAATAQGAAKVVEHLGRITGYATGIGFFAHAVGETNTEIKALICAADEISGGGFLLPTRNGDLFRWCLANDLKLVHQMTLMTIGLYSEPAGAYLPSILY